MKILSIGNSFSQDAQRYLHGVAKSAGIPMKNVNLYIGGCSLEQHYRNMQGDRRAYDLEFLGNNTGFRVSIKEALLSDSWDVVTLQQVSTSSYVPDSYHPYLEKLAAYVRELCPGCKLWFHETWAYENGSDHLANRNYPDHESMLHDIRIASQNAAESMDADGIIPSGEVMGLLSQEGVKTHRDGFHVSLGVGRYALALTWLAALTDAKPEEDNFTDFDVPVSNFEREIAKQCAGEAVFPL